MTVSDTEETFLR